MFAASPVAESWLVGRSSSDLEATACDDLDVTLDLVKSRLGTGRNGGRARKDAATDALAKLERRAGELIGLIDELLERRIMTSAEVKNFSSFAAERTASLQR